VLIIRRSKLHYTTSGIITPIDVTIPEAVKQKFYSSSWLITEIKPKLQFQISCVGGNYRLFGNLVLSLHVAQMDVEVKVMELLTDVRIGGAPLSLLFFVGFPYY